MHGVAEFIVNDRKRDTAKFIFDLTNKDKSQREVTLKAQEFFKWYSGFQNVEKIKKVELLTSDYSCASGCKLPLNLKFNLMELDFFRSLTIKLVEKECAKYKLPLTWQKDGADA